MSKPDKRYHGKWGINNHVVSRFRTRVEGVPNGTASQIRRRLACALNDVSDAEIMRIDSDVFYCVYFRHNEKKCGPYYCLTREYEPRAIVSLLTEEQFRTDWQKRGGSLEDLYEEDRIE